jgi:2-keto-4-pentenoate hydratase/2-oxohepta-3-ene-1,7-dioic acid hydratase in catechol pathway
LSTWSLVTFQTAAGVDEVGALTGSTVRQAPEELRAPGLFALLQRWDEVVDTVAHANPYDWPAIAEAEIQAPIRFPRKLLGACANYRQHLDQFGARELSQQWSGFFHMTPPTTTIIGPGQDIPMPAHEGVELDWEAELAIVIGRRGHQIPLEEALDHVAGYTIANDISDRGAFNRGGDGPPSLVFDWVTSKGQDGFKPMGPGLVPRHLVSDPQRLQVRLEVNGEVKQDYSTSTMTLGVRELIRDASHMMTLEPGDVIMTGSGPGNAWHREGFLEVGARVRAEIEGFGVLENAVAP